MKNDKKEAECLFHTWNIVRDTGTVVYRECKKCGKRDSKKYSNKQTVLYDTSWIKGGHFVETV